MTGLVIKSTGSWYQVKTETGMLDVRLRGKFKLENKKITNPIAVGDQVVVGEHHTGEWIINEINPRTNYIIRQSPRKKHHDHLIATNVDQAVLIVTLKMPRTSIGFIDRFLVTLETFRIPGILIFNKMDLLEAEEQEYVDFLSYRYAKLGYQCLSASFLDEELDPNIIALLSNKITVVSGHSGSGKSTLINKLLPQVDQKVAEISSFANKGVHTTTFAEMFFLNEKTGIIDTPGIKELGLSEVYKEELDHYFPEMRGLLGNCKFHNCQHINEPGCAVKEAVDRGEVSAERYQSYLSILSGEDNRR